MKLQKLWYRGHSPFLQIEESGIRFFCFETCTTMPVAGLYVSGEKENETTEDETKSWEVFIPFGKSATIGWLHQWVVTVICTPYGALETSWEWVGGGAACYAAFAIFPDGTEMTIEGDSEPQLNTESLKVWEEKSLRFGETFVEVSIKR